MGIKVPKLPYLYVKYQCIQLRKESNAKVLIIYLKMILKICDIILFLFALRNGNFASIDYNSSQQTIFPRNIMEEEATFHNPATSEYSSTKIKEESCLDNQALLPFNLYTKTSPEKLYR